MNLVLITSRFPYGNGETFIENEIKVLSKRFDIVYLIPVGQKSERVRPVPGNIQVLDILQRETSIDTGKIFRANLSYILRLLAMELANTNSKAQFLKTIRTQVTYLCQIIHYADVINRFIGSMPDKKKNVYYSFWMNEGAFLFSILKDRGVIDRFVFRVLGYDLYDERREGNYMPFRYFNFKMTDKVYCISRDGFNYLKKKNLFPDKIALSHLSVFDNGVNPYDPNGIFTVVSCSNIYALKRVHLIVEILRNISFEVRWVHFGGGDLKDDVMKQASTLPSNIKPEFKGLTSNPEILEFYRTNSVNVLIHVSETEGGAPVALQEAASFGIPLIGTNAGGIPEIVTEQTGVLIPVDFNIEEVSKIVENFRQSKYSTIEFRNGAREFWRNHFNAEKIYNQLCDELIGERAN